jgi:Thioredoxin like C-terminal domain
LYVGDAVAYMKAKKQIRPVRNSKAVRLKVTLDGVGEVREPRLYQFIRQKGQAQDCTFEIEFLDPGIQALDFTFGCTREIWHPYQQRKYYYEYNENV